MYSRFSAAVRFSVPPLETRFRVCLPPNHAFECRDLCFVFLKKISRSGVFIEGPCLKLPDPDSDEVARDVAAFGESVERLARHKFLGDLPFKLNAMGTVPGHGFHPLKARQPRSIPNL
jgi:hypothetical protein